MSAMISGVLDRMRQELVQKGWLIGSQLEDGWEWAYVVSLDMRDAICFELSNMSGNQDMLAYEKIKESKNLRVAGLRVLCMGDLKSNTMVLMKVKF